MKKPRICEHEEKHLHDLILGAFSFEMDRFYDNVLSDLGTVDVKMFEKINMKDVFKIDHIAQISIDYLNTNSCAKCSKKK